MLLVVSSPSPGAVHAAAEVLRRDEVVGLPTDTVYGLAALPASRTATARLFALKGRAADVPVAVLCASAHQAFDLAAEVPDAARRLADAFWPGPLTLVLRRREGIGYHVGEPADSIGVRCPDHPLVLALAAEVGPLATTSANRHGEPTPVTAAEVQVTFGEALGLVLDGGRCDGAPSTVVDASGGTVRVLRAGPITPDQLDAAVAG